jgi:hypothetical protein
LIATARRKGVGRIRNPINTGKGGDERVTTTSRIATVEVPFEALVKELCAKRAIEFISEIREC